MSGTAASGLLAAVIAATRRRVQTAREDVSLEAIRAAAASRPAARPLSQALARAGRVNVIAECKRRSPSRGVLRREYDAAAIAASYERAGAAAISVLTEPTFFDGELDHLRAVRGAVTVPVLRKDFIVEPYQIWEARAAGADAVLLIAAALADRELQGLLRETADAGLEALVEVHDEAELDRALEAGAVLVGVNNRDLRTLRVDLDTSRRLAARLAPGVLAVAESGLRTAAELHELRALGYGGFLIGERFMTAADPGAALAALLGDASSAAPPAPPPSREAPCG